MVKYEREEESAYFKEQKFVKN